MRSSIAAPLVLALLSVSLASACTDDDGDGDPPDLGASAQEVINDVTARVAAGLYHSCAVREDTTVQCWGRNDLGQLGDGTLTSSPTPRTVVGLTGVVAVTAGSYHTCAALDDGTARCWGQGTSGQLGDGSTANRTTPVVVSGLTSVTSLSAGGSHTCAGLASGAARCWGSNTYGQLGNATTTSRTTPTTVGIVNVVEIDAGRWSTCARTTGNVVHCWGRNNYGQLGDGTTTDRKVPAVVTGVSSPIDLSVGDFHACAALATGRVRCWGYNFTGALGDGTQIGRTTAVDMVRRNDSNTFNVVMSSVSAVSAGQYHTCVVKSGQLWCVGYNDKGQLARNLSEGVLLLAKPADPPIAATQVAAGGRHTCAMRPGGAIVCVGDDGHGQVGDQGRCPTRPTATVTSVTAPGAHLIAKQDGRGPIYYTDGSRLDVTLETTACAEVSQVDFKWGPIEEDDPIEPSDGLDYQVFTSDRTDGTRELRVRIDFQNFGRGTTYPVAIQVRSPAGQTASVGFTHVEVLEANAANDGHDGVIDLGEEEILNEVLQAMYAKFGDGNYWSRGGVNFYDLDYEHLYVGISPAGVTFEARVKADLIAGPVDSDLCNPTATVWGTFKVVPAGRSITTEWVDEVDMDIRFPLGCQLVTLDLIDVVGAIVGAVKDDNVERKIQDRVGALESNCPDLTDCDVIAAIEHQDDRIRIRLKDYFDAVTFAQPYLSSQLDAQSVGDPMRRGIALPPGADVLMVVGGTAEACGVQACPEVNHRFGASGLFNWNWEPRRALPAEDEPWGAHPPILDPWPCGPLGCASIAGRQGPWLRQQGLRRDLSRLLAPGRNVGAVLARTLGSDGSASGLLYGGDYACTLEPTTTEAARLVVGRNDIPTGPLAGEYGRGDALVTLVFSALDVGRRCAAAE